MLYRIKVEHDVLASSGCAMFSSIAHYSLLIFLSQSSFLQLRTPNQELLISVS
jgi:hypothetical protein